MKTVRPLGLYIHIPFCKAKCVYCDFYSLPHSEDRMDAYTDALCAHLTEAAPMAASHTVDTVYFGGGTPSYLGEKRLCKILKVIEKRYQVARDAEITLEANPDSAGDWKALRALRRCGFNRISLGMQSACDEELRTIGRVHTMEQVQQAAEAARKAKIQNLSLDLIYGLPHQTQERWMENLAAAVALNPEHLSCYGLKVEEGTPLFAMKDTAGLPGDEEQADMYLQTVEFLKQYGYEQYEISNFAKPGRESRHNLKYWKLQEYAGFGPGPQRFRRRPVCLRKRLGRLHRRRTRRTVPLFRKHRHPAQRPGRGMGDAGCATNLRSGSQGLRSPVPPPV